MRDGENFPHSHRSSWRLALLERSEALEMEENSRSLKGEQGEEHEEGEISDEEPPLPSSSSEDQVESSKLDDHDTKPETAAISPSASDRDPPLLHRRAGLDELIELGNSELKGAIGHTKKRADVYRPRGRELDSSTKEDDSGKSLKGNGWGAYGSNLYNFAWAQAVSGRPSFNSGADSPSFESSSSKHSGDGLLSSGSGSVGSWPTENHRKLSRTFSRESEFYGRSSGKSSEDDDMSPLRENGSRVGEKGSSERADTTGRGRIVRETSWSERDTPSSWAEKPQTVRSRIEISERGLTTESEFYYKGPSDGEDARWRKQHSESQSPNGKFDEVPSGQHGQDNGDTEDREEGELEEGEIELGSLPSPQPASPTKEPPDSSRQNKYSGLKGVEHWTPKDWAYTRSLSSKSQSRSQIEDHSSRRHRQAKPQESQRERRLSLAGDLVKNVTVKDAQKSFVDVCGRLHKALRVLDELHTTSRQGAPQEGRLETVPREITALARQAFAGIRAVYAVRNTASGREQERDKNIFPRLLELANGYCQKLFTPKQTRELEVMMQTIANAGRLIRDGAEKGQYPREHQLQPAPKKNTDNDATPGDSLGNSAGSIKVPVSTQPKSSSESSLAARVLGFVDAKQAEEAAAIAAAALAYAQSSAAARANSLFGSNDSRSSGASVQGTGAWGWVSESPSPVQFTNPATNSVQPNNNGYNPSIGKYQSWSDTDQRTIKLGQDGYSGHFVEAKALNAQAPLSTLLQGSKAEKSVPPGYSKSASTFGILEDDWEELSPPGAGISSYVPGAAAPVAPVQTGGVKEESSRGKAWTSRPEAVTIPPFKKSRGTAPQYPAEHLLNLNQQRNRDAAHMYSTERLPSPTPDEDEDTAIAPGPLSQETKSGLLDMEIKNSSVLSQPQGTGNMPNSMLLPGSIHNLIRSQSLEGPGPVTEPKIQKERPELMLPLTTRSSDDTESAKNSFSLPPKGIFRSRDPRRRFQNHSLDLTDMGGMDLNNQVIAASNLNPGEATGTDRNKKRIVPDVDDRQDIGMQKRQKVQSESNVDANSFNLDCLHASSGTGGWLDDNIVPSFGTIEELPTAMEVDEEGPSKGLEGRKGIGSDVKLNADGSADVYPDLLNGIGASKNQKVDLGQQMGEGGHRKMKPRDPRRVFLENHVERGDGAAGDMLRADGMVTGISSKGEVSTLVRGTVEVASWSKKVVTQVSKQGASSPNIAPHFMENLASIAGTVGSSLSSVTQHIVNSGGGQVVNDIGVSTTSLDVNGPPVSSNSISQELSEHQKEKPPSANTGPRKPKGNPSQWGASQVHPGLEQLLGDLTDEERRTVQLERTRRMEEQDRMFSAGKLCLVLDLDHTLLNSAKFSEIEQEWDQRLRVAESAERNRAGRDGLERRELYRFPHMSMWTKLRPGIWKFLARASQLFELHVYTMGNKVYATEMAKLLDPSGKLFAGRVISKGDDGDGDDLLPKSKDLDGVLGMESAVVIIDDSARVWPHHSENLIVVERYMYFPCSRRQFGLAGPSLLEVGHDERESDGMLASALGVIDRIHQSFFKNPRLREVDVREILATQQRQVLAGCKVVFSRVFPVGEAEPHRHPLWRTAEQFGAICTITIDELVTHVVAISLGTDKVNWALETGRYVVRPGWLEASTILYRRANERDFPVLPQ